MHLILAEPYGMHLEMATEDYLCSLLLSTCGHALLATGNGLMLHVTWDAWTLQFSKVD